MKKVFHDNLMVIKVTPPILQWFCFLGSFYFCKLFCENSRSLNLCLSFSFLETFIDDGFRFWLAIAKTGNPNQMSDENEVLSGVLVFVSSSSSPWVGERILSICKTQTRVCWFEEDLTLWLRFRFWVFWKTKIVSGFWISLALFKNLWSWVGLKIFCVWREHFEANFHVSEKSEMNNRFTDGIDGNEL